MIGTWRRADDVAELKQRLDILNTLVNERFAAHQTALNLALSANDKRLEGLNEFRQSLSDQTSHYPTRNEVEVMISGLRSDSYSNLAPLQVKVDAMGKPNIVMMIALVGTLFSVVSASWVIIGLKIDSTNLPVQVAIQSEKIDAEQLNDRMRAAEGMITQSNQADSVSRADRAQLNSRLVTLEQIAIQNTGEVRTLSASTSAKLVEVETQFKLLSDILNMDKDQDQRLFSLLWLKAYPGETLPQVLFRPSMFKGETDN
jgi:hypothetical protein